jgi:hypothetical protein
MEAFDAQSLAAVALTSGLGFAMVWLATRMNVLEQRSAARCPACGVLRRRGSCRCVS